jgi:DNA-binding IclR family transcriptional regulator
MTEKKLAILDFIKDYREKNRISPKFIEMSERFGITDSTLHEHLAWLVKKGFLVKDGRENRNYVPVKERHIVCENCNHKILIDIEKFY